MTRTVFYGFGAYVGTINAQRQCAWWPDDPNALNWTNSLLVPTDFSKTPSAARQGAIPVSDIIVDDDILAGGLTELGPLFPLGRPVAACWLRDTFWDQLGANKPPRLPNNDWYDYELTSVQYWDGELDNRRFFGFHGEILGVHATLSQLKLWHPGWAKGPSPRVAAVAWLDLSQVTDPNFTTLHDQGDRGAVFIDRDTVQSLSVSRPKLPTGAGYGDLF
jgi:hypothetical protein